MKKEIIKLKEKCKECGKRTKFMYRLNEGLFCEKHWEIALWKQSNYFRRKDLENRISELSKPPVLPLDDILERYNTF